jgi:hypothetical protein
MIRVFKMSTDGSKEKIETVRKDRENPRTSSGRTVIGPKY